MNATEPVLHPTPILSLRPTQMTVGMQEVRRKRDEWKTKAARDLEKFLGQHMVPTFSGSGASTTSSTTIILRSPSTKKASRACS